MTEEFKPPIHPTPDPSDGEGPPEKPPKPPRPSSGRIMYPHADDSAWADLVRFARDAEGFWETALAGFGMLLAVVCAPFYLVAAVACCPSWAVGRLARKAFRSTRKVVPAIPARCGYNPPPPPLAPTPGDPGWRGHVLHWPKLVDELDAKESDLRNNTLGGVPLRDLHAHKDTSPRPPLIRDSTGRKIPRSEGVASLDVKPPPTPGDSDPRAEFLNPGEVLYPWRPLVFSDGLNRRQDAKGPPVFPTCRDAVRECLNAILAGRVGIGPPRPWLAEYKQCFSQAFVVALRDVIEREKAAGARPDPLTYPRCERCAELEKTIRHLYAEGEDKDRATHE